MNALAGYESDSSASDVTDEPPSPSASCSGEERARHEEEKQAERGPRITLPPPPAWLKPKFGPSADNPEAHGGRKRAKVFPKGTVPALVYVPGTQCVACRLVLGALPPTYVAFQQSQILPSARLRPHLRSSGNKALPQATMCTSCMKVGAATWRYTAACRVCLACEKAKQRSS